jgi:RNA polymerase sigma factor (TIGR02999 family)
MSDMPPAAANVTPSASTPADELLPLVYTELRHLAAQRLAHETPGQTLDATALVHEAYLRLHRQKADAAGTPAPFANRGHFFAAAAEAMRRILIENARRKGRLKRGGDHRRVALPDVALSVDATADDLAALDAALTALAAEDPAKANLVKLRYFAGLSVEDAAACLGISRATADRWWAYARAWLFDRVHGGGTAPAP